MNHSLDKEVLTKLCDILIEDNVPWKKLAEKLGMLTLTHLYQESTTPCQMLLENYQVRDCLCVIRCICVLYRHIHFRWGALISNNLLIGFCQVFLSKVFKLYVLWESNPQPLQ